MIPALSVLTLKPWEMRIHMIKGDKETNLLEACSMADTVSGSSRHYQIYSLCKIGMVILILNMKTGAQRGYVTYPSVHS